MYFTHLPRSKVQLSPDKNSLQVPCVADSLAWNPGFIRISRLDQWSFLVPLIGGRYRIIPQLALCIYHLYTTYILPIGWLYGTYHLFKGTRKLHWLEPKKNALPKTNITIVSFWDGMFSGLSTVSLAVLPRCFLEWRLVAGIIPYNNLIIHLKNSILLGCPGGRRRSHTSHTSNWKCKTQNLGWPYLFLYSFRVGRSILEIQSFTAKLQTLQKTAGPHGKGEQITPISLREDSLILQRHEVFHRFGWLWFTLEWCFT